MKSIHFCGKCGGYRETTVEWVKFFMETQRIDTAFICKTCDHPQIHTQGKQKQKLFSQLSFDFPIPA